MDPTPVPSLCGHKAGPRSPISYLPCCHSLIDMILSSKIPQIWALSSPLSQSVPTARPGAEKSAWPSAVAMMLGLDLRYFQPCFCFFLDLPYCTNSHSLFLSGSNHILPPHLPEDLASLCPSKPQG